MLTCKNGHEMTPENTHTSPRGDLSCRTCDWVRNRQRRAYSVNVTRKLPADRMSVDMYRAAYEAGTLDALLMARLG